MRFTFNVRGEDSVVQAMDKQEQKVNLRVIRAALRFGMKPAIADAKRRVPYSYDDDDDYHLRDSIGVRAERKKNRAGNATVMRFGAHRETLTAGHPSGYAVAGGLSKSRQAPNYARIIEEKSPFIEPAVKRNIPAILRGFAQKLKKAVIKK